MRKSIFWGQLLLFGVAFLVGCSDETNVTSHTTGDRYNGRIIGMIHGIITARDTNTPMANVTVEYAVHGGTRLTRSDANGYYRTENLDEGTYTIGFFSPDTGYADWREVVAIRLDTSKVRPSDVDYRVVMSRDVPMYRRNAGIQGYVYAQVGNETLVPAADVEVRATGFGNVILSADYVARADSNGYYVFSSLPATPTAVVIAMPWTNNSVTYGIGTTRVDLIPGAIAVAENIVVVPATAGIIVIGNNFGDGDFPVDGAINLVFSRPIDDDSLFSYLRGPWGDVHVVHTLDASGVNLSIDPIEILHASSDYVLTVNGRGADYTQFSYTAWIKTELGIKLESTTLWQIDGQNREDVGLTEALGFTFTKPVDVTNPDNEVWIRRGGSDILVSASYSNENKTLTVAPIGSFLPETWYRVYYFVYSTLPEDCTACDFYFRTIRDAVAPGTVSGLQCDTLNYIDWDDWRAIPLSWNVAQNATGYQIYAYDSYQVTHRILVGTVQSGAPFGRVETAIWLPPEFDWLDGDDIQTPFSNGIIVRFMVRATNAVGEGPLSSEVAVRDVTAPKASDITLWQDSTCNNNRQVPKTVRVSIPTYSPIEYCNTTVAAQWQFKEAGNPGYLLPHEAARWEWDAGMRTGSLIITVPALSNGANDSLKLWGISDNSGNVMSDTVRWRLN